MGQGGTQIFFTPRSPPQAPRFYGVNPPSMVMTSPVMYAAESLAR